MKDPITESGMPPRDADSAHNASTQDATMADFSDLIDAQLSGYRNGFDPGAQVSGVIVEIGDEYAVLDVNAKREGLLPLEELRDADDALEAGPGDRIEVWFAGMREGAFLFARRLSDTAALDRSLADAFESQMPVQGLVVEENKGGYQVEIGGKRAFCPYSQMDRFRVEGAAFVGQRLHFLVSEYDPAEGQIVLSRRALLERERASQRDLLRETLSVGEQREGTVTRLAEFGVFVDLGGVEGLVPLSELAWKRGLKPQDVVQPGESVRVAVREIDWERDRISLSLRETQPDPWEEIGGSFPVGTRFRGLVTRLESFGAFVELTPGVEGLVPVSWLGGGRRIAHPREVVSEGGELELRVEALDIGARRISLRPVDLRVEKLDPERIEPGAEVEGIVEQAREFGVFVRLSEERTGLLHVSETGLPKGGNRQGKLEQAYPPGSSLRVRVKSVEGTRVSLTLPGRETTESAENEAAEYLRRQSAAPANLGSLAEAFDKLDV